MGEATYYLKARIPGLNEEVEAEITRFLGQGQDAYDYWQAHRGNPDGAAFWADFRARFPEVYDYLGDLRDGDHSNGLAGHLDFADEEPHRDDEGSDVLLYSGYVWHMAEWDTLCDYLQRRWSATAEWTSDEYADIFDTLHV